MLTKKKEKRKEKKVKKNININLSAVVILGQSNHKILLKQVSNRKIHANHNIHL